MSTPNETGIQAQKPLDLSPIVDPPPVAKAAPIPVVLPAPEETPPQPAPDGARLAKAAKPPVKHTQAEFALHTLAAWTARLIVGVFMICNFFPLSFITAVAAFGWLMRLMQSTALRGWFRESPRRAEMTFQDFLESLGPDAPVQRPRWFVRDRLMQTLEKISRGDTVLALLRTAWTMVTLPIHSLLVNFKAGVSGLFTTYLVTGWGCFIMLFSWYFGWYNSFNKGYEDAPLGPLSGLLGSFLLILALMYVPMAQAHQAAAGEISAFFQFRIVLRLILTRLTAYVMLAGGLALTTVLFGLPRFMTLSGEFGPNRADTPQQAYLLLELYWLAWSIPFFLILLTLRMISAMIYRSAMLKAVRTGTVLVSDLPPKIAFWFEKLEIIPQAQLPQNVIVTALKTTISLKYRAMMFSILFGIWVLFVMWFYVGYFLVFSEYRGVLNHPVVHVPCIDWTPWHLVHGEEE